MSNFGSLPNILDYGAHNDGTNASANDTAWTNAFAAGNKVFFPAGTYLFSTSKTLPSSDGCGIQGEGMDKTFLQLTQTTGDFITVPDVNGAEVSDATITRSSQATSGSGIVTSDGLDRSIIRRVHLTQHNVGLHLGGCGYSVIENVISTGNRSHGVEMASSTRAMTWQLNNLFSALNGGDGFHLAPTTNYPSGCSVGQWRGLSAYNNGGYGMYLYNLAQIRLSDSFLGNDTSGEIYVLGGGASDYPHLFTNVAVEQSAGFGFWFDGTSTAPASLLNCSAEGCGSHGLFWNCPALTVTVQGGGYRKNNNIGIYNYRGNLLAQGVWCPTAGNQTSSIYQDSGNNGDITVVGCQCGGNSGVTVGGATLSYVNGNF